MRTDTSLPPVVLITGAAKRIGAALAKTFHQAGYRLLLHAHHSWEAATALCDQFNEIRADSALVIIADLLNADVLHTIIPESITWAGQLDVLIHNASCFIRTPAHASPQVWDTLFTVNVKAPYDLSWIAYPYLKQQQGCILYLTDIHAYKPLKDYAIYCQTKAALTMQMLSFAKAFAPDIRVNAIAPGSIIWPEGDNLLSWSIQQKMIQKTPLKKQGSPMDIAKTALFLAKSPFITGITLPVDGGRSTL